MSTITQLANQPFLYVNGLQSAWTSNTSITVQAGQCRDSTNAMDINIGNFQGLAGGVTPNTATVVSFSTNGLNGLDTGTIAASTYYYLYAIADIAGSNPPGFILSKSNSQPAMPQGIFGTSYSNFRLVGGVAVDGSSHIILFTSSGNGSGKFIEYAAFQSVITSGTSTTMAPINLINFVPNIPVCSVLLLSVYTPTAAGDTVYFRTPGTGTTTTSAISNVGQVAAVKIVEQISILAAQETISSVVSPAIDYMVSAGTLTNLGVTGYTLNL